MRIHKSCLKHTASTTILLTHTLLVSHNVSLSYYGRYQLLSPSRSRFSIETYFHGPKMFPFGATKLSVYTFKNIVEVVISLLTIYVVVLTSIKI